jgi:transposase InsO family protein/transposase-like protein
MNKEIKNSKVMRYSYEQKVKIVEDYLQSKLTVQKYSKISGVSQGSLHRWLSQFNERSNYVHRRFSPEQRKETIEAFKKSGLTQKDFAKTWGIDSKTLGQWNKIYKSEGPKGLMDGVIYPTKETPEKRGRKGTPQMLKEKVIEVKKRLPDYGLKKLRDVLSRFEGISIAPNTIKKVLVENDLYVAPEVPPKKDVKQHITRFERATPMQLWQSDITSFVLKRTGQRVYLVVFKDDHSRYVVSWSLALQQTGNFVIECLLDGVQEYGLPQEVLTDQGRQYFSWRGKSEFQKVLAREGIEHVVARSHHPQTLGKCERLWKTIGIEFWERAKPQNLDEARERLGHYFNHYNHFRPHQGLDGMTPADRFFGVQDELRKVIEETMTKNELRVALDQSPRRPLYFVGQIGDQKLTMHGEKGEIVINTPDGSTKRLNYDELGRDNTEYNEDRWEKQTRETQKEIYSPEDANSGESALGVSDDGRKRESALASDHNYGILDGYNNQNRSIEETWSGDTSSVADGTNGTSGNVCRITETTKEDRNDRQRERSERIEEENQGIGENYRNSESTDCDPALSSWRRNVWGNESFEPGAESGEGAFGSGDSRKEEGSKTWQEAKGRVSLDTLNQLREKWRKGLSKKDEN